MTDLTVETQPQGLIELALMRKLSSDQAETVKKLQSHLEETPEYKSLLEAKATLDKYKAKEVEITDEIKTSKTSVITETIKTMTKEQRTAAFNEFKELLPKGLSLRVNHLFEYNEQDAIKWCETNAKTVLKTVLDKKPFEALAEVTDIEFVKKIDVPTITIASDLSMYL